MNRKDRWTAGQRRPRKSPEPFACADCASSIRFIHHGDAVMDVVLQHSSTCPAWSDERPELLAQFLPKNDTLS